MTAIEPFRPQPLPTAADYPTNPYTPVYAPVPIGPDHDPVVYVPNAYGELVPMLKSQIPQTIHMAPVRDLATRPLIDPRAQVLAAGGVAAAGVGWGASEILSAIAGIGTGAVAALAVAILALRMAPAAIRATTGTGVSASGVTAAGSTTYITNTTTNVQNTNRWLGRSTTQVTNQ